MTLHDINTRRCESDITRCRVRLRRGVGLELARYVRSHPSVHLTRLLPSTKGEIRNFDGIVGTPAGCRCCSLVPSAPVSTVAVDISFISPKHAVVIIIVISAGCSDKSWSL